MSLGFSPSFPPSSIPATAIKAWMPKFWELGISFSPRLTQRRFTPVKATISAIVPSVSNSKHSLINFSCKLNLARTDMARINAIPTPETCDHSLSWQTNLGFKIASAMGNSPVKDGSWWSVTMTIKPNSLALWIGRRADVPLSTVIRIL